MAMSGCEICIVSFFSFNVLPYVGLSLGLICRSEDTSRATRRRKHSFCVCCSWGLATCIPCDVEIYRPGFAQGVFLFWALLKGQGLFFF